eukprot:70072_1
MQDKISNFAVSKKVKYENDALETIKKFNYTDITTDYDQWNMEKVSNDLNELLLKWFKAGELNYKWIEQLKAQFPATDSFSEANLYGLWKSHKVPVALRIITSSIRTILKHVSVLIVHAVMPSWKAAGKYMIKDSNSFVLIIKDINEDPELIKLAIEGKLKKLYVSGNFFLFTNSAKQIKL